MRRAWNQSGLTMYQLWRLGSYSLPQPDSCLAQFRLHLCPLPTSNYCLHYPDCNIVENCLHEFHLQCGVITAAQSALRNGKGLACESTANRD